MVWAKVFLTGFGTPRVRSKAGSGWLVCPPKPSETRSSRDSIEATSATISLLPGLSAEPGKVRRMVLERRMKSTLPMLLEASASRKKVSTSFLGWGVFGAAALPSRVANRRSNKPIVCQG